ncbi:MAG TPA: hypothetical protein VF187_00715, partial [Gemmatimonadales bacterium]
MTPPGRHRLLRWLSSPVGIVSVALIAGWLAIYFAYRDDWLGLILAMITTAGGFLAMDRGEMLSRQRQARLEGAVAAADARNRELELLRRLGSILLGVRSSGEL